MPGDDLQNIRWFSRVGEPIAAPLPRLRSWDAWAGPQDPRVEALHLRQQAFHDHIVANDPTVENLFLTIRDQIVEAAGRYVAYDPTSDAWDPQSLAVWHAGWTAALVACYETRNIELPHELAEQWYWFRQGHWPAAFVSDPPEAADCKCVVL
jgi:hypothetical protein